MNLYKKGKLNKEGISCSIDLLLPTILIGSKQKTFTKDIQKTTKISFPTYFLLTTDSYYYKIEFIILGLGLSLELNWINSEYIDE